MVTPNFFLKIKFSPNKKMSITSQVGTHVKNPGPYNLFMILEKKNFKKKKIALLNQSTNKLSSPIMLEVKKYFWNFGFYIFISCLINMVFK